MPTAVGSYATTASVKSRLGITDATDDTLLGTLCDQLNAWIEVTCGRVIAPIPGTSLTIDGNLAEDRGRVLPVPFGLNSLTTLEVALRTGGMFVTVPSTDWFLRPLAIHRPSGWPATLIVMTDLPSAGNSVGRFWPGYANVRLTGPEGFLGFPAIPDDLEDVANTAVVRAWHARLSGQVDIVGNDETGAPIVTRFLSSRDWKTLARYDVHQRTAGGDRTVTSYA